MISIISPAKSMTVDKEDVFTKSPESLTKSEILFKSNSSEILQKIQQHSAQEIQKLMSVSEKIAQLNYKRFRNFNSLETKQALLAFDGDVYTSMERNDYTEQDFAFAQNHLRIMSGLYGVLRPLDMIKPYRLEMSTKLQDFAPKGMDKYWQKEVTKTFNSLLSEQENPVLINLASNEYSAAINFSELKYNFINIHFRQNRNGELKNIAINAKRARGMVANYIIKNQIDTVDGLINFNQSGYSYARDLSDKYNVFFIRQDK